MDNTESSSEKPAPEVDQDAARTLGRDPRLWRAVGLLLGGGIIGLIVGLALGSDGGSASTQPAVVEESTTTDRLASGPSDPPPPSSDLEAEAQALFDLEWISGAVQPTPDHLVAFGCENWSDDGVLLTLVVGGTTRDASGDWIINRREDLGFEGSSTGCCDSSEVIQVSGATGPMLVNNCRGGTSGASRLYVAGLDEMSGQPRLLLRAACGITHPSVTDGTLVLETSGARTGAAQPSPPQPDFRLEWNGDHFHSPDDWPLYDWYCGAGGRQNRQLPIDASLRDSDLGAIWTLGPVVFAREGYQCSRIWDVWRFAVRHWMDDDYEADPSPIASLLGWDPPDGETDWMPTCFGSQGYPTHLATTIDGSPVPAAVQDTANLIAGDARFPSRTKLELLTDTPDFDFGPDGQDGVAGWFADDFGATALGEEPFEVLEQILSGPPACDTDNDLYIWPASALLDNAGDEPTLTIRSDGQWTSFRFAPTF